MPKDKQAGHDEVRDTESDAVETEQPLNSTDEQAAEAAEEQVAGEEPIRLLKRGWRAGWPNSRLRSRN